VWSKLSSVKWADAWDERFYGNPNSVITEIKGGKSVRIEVYCEKEAEAIAIQGQFGGSVRELKSRNWVAMSAPKMEPLMIRNRLVISQVEVEAERFPGKEVLVVPPEMAFGTGDHPTTATCLRFLVDFSCEQTPGWSLLDLGTGSGVLAMAGKSLGAGAVTAFDFDAKAVEVAGLNLARNEITGVDLFDADVFAWKNENRFSVVVANLFSTVLIAALPLIEKWVEPQGILILSGILAEQWPEVKKTATKAGFVCREEKAIGKWVTASFRAS
jgi:ribosomal protein L11 methyltransferase